MVNVAAVREAVNSLLSETSVECWRIPSMGYTLEGVPSDGTEESFQAQLRDATDVDRMTDIEISDATHQLHVGGEFDVDIRTDRIRILGDAEAARRPVLRVEKRRIGDEVFCTVLWLGGEA